MLRVASDVTGTGRLFHTRAAATGKARSPTVESRVGRTTKALVVADCILVIERKCYSPWTEDDTCHFMFVMPRSHAYVLQ